MTYQYMKEVGPTLPGTTTLRDLSSWENLGGRDFADIQVLGDWVIACHMMKRGEKGVFTRAMNTAARNNIGDLQALRSLNPQLLPPGTKLLQDLFVPKNKDQS